MIYTYRQEKDEELLKFFVLFFTSTGLIKDNNHQATKATKYFDI